MHGTTLRDPLGIPQLRADDVLALAWLQGRNAVIDRGWQLELARHRAAGTSAAFLGPAALSWDRFARQARLVDTARRCFAGLDDETRAWVSSYTDGVNSALAQTEAPEFDAVELQPGHWEPWAPLAGWLSAHVLFAGVATKLWRTEAARLLGTDALSLFTVDGAHSSGSNGWLVEGTRSASGAAIIAGDPHRNLENPGVYQQIRLVCPEFDVVGFAIPGVPGIAHFGHTGSVAWAITNAMADYQDVYRERLRRGPDGGVEAFGVSGWEPADAHVETIAVRGREAPEPVEVVETSRGTVVVGGPDDDGPVNHEALSLRWVPRVTGELGFAALLPLLRSTSVADVDRALESWVEPVNVVLAADRAGGTLHRVAGRVPVRDSANRVRAVPAWEPHTAWRGWEPMPRTEIDGVAVMANERGLAGPLGSDFAAPHRARRIRELLEATDAWRAADMAAVHADTRSGSAPTLLGVLARIVDDFDSTLEGEAERFAKSLVAWDRRMDAGSVEAAAYASLRRAVLHGLAAHPALAPLATVAARFPEVFGAWTNHWTRLGYALENLLANGSRLGIDVDAVVRSAVVEASAAASQHPWGETHRSVPWHPLPAFAVELAGLSGDSDCVLATSTVAGVNDDCIRGPVARYVWDLADRSASRWVVPLGAAGDPRDPHHRDQSAAWTSGELLPVIMGDGPG